MLKSHQVNSKWINCIQRIQDNSVRRDLWVRQPTTVNLSIGKMIKQNLLDQFLQNWNVHLQDSSKGRNYSLFKNKSFSYHDTPPLRSLLVCILNFDNKTSKIFSKCNHLFGRYLGETHFVHTSRAVTRLKNKEKQNVIG